MYWLYPPIVLMISATHWTPSTVLDRQMFPGVFQFGSLCYSDSDGPWFIKFSSLVARHHLTRNKQQVNCTERMKLKERVIVTCLVIFLEKKGSRYRTSRRINPFSLDLRVPLYSSSVSWSASKVAPWIKTGVLITLQPWGTIYSEANNSKNPQFRKLAWKGS